MAQPNGRRGGLVVHYDGPFLPSADEGRGRRCLHRAIASNDFGSSRDHVYKIVGSRSVDGAPSKRFTRESYKSSPTSLTKTRRRDQDHSEGRLKMNQHIRPQDSLSGISSEERHVREQLAAFYRICDRFGWTELIYNHITARVPGPERHFLINRFGLMYQEITASNLVKIDIDGNVVDGSDAKVNAPGFTIHSAIHMAREDAHYIVHTHTTEGVTVACTEEGLSPHNFYGAQLYGQIAYHDFEGISVDLSERERLVASLGNRNYMILRHHGLLTCGDTTAAAFFRMYQVQRACRCR